MIFCQVRHQIIFGLTTKQICILAQPNKNMSSLFNFDTPSPLGTMMGILHILSGVDLKIEQQYN